MADYRGTPAKIIRPVARGILLRERLFERLDEARAGGVVWVSGPAGAGKTTLLSSYVDARGLPCLWYQIDSGDEDLATFFYYLGLAGARAAPRRKTRLPLLTPEYLAGIAEYSRSFFEALCQRLKPPSVLILDGYQGLPENAPLHTALREGLSRLPAGTSLLFASREDPPWEFARLHAHGNLSVLGWRELRLTPDEARAVARHKGFDDEQAEALDELCSRADGWAAGLQLLLEAARIEGGGLNVPARPMPREVLDYLGHEVFGRLEPDVKTFLLRTSFLPSMTSALAEGITGNRSAEGILENLSRRNLFTSRRPGRVATYEYHSLFREFLQERAAKLLGDGVQEIRRQAGSLLRDAGEPEQAAALFQEAEDWGALSRLALESAPVLLSQGRSRTLETWLDVLTPAEVENNPWLLFWRGMCRLHRDPIGAREPLERAYERFLAGSEPAGAYSAWAGVVETYFFEWNSFGPLDRWIDELPGLRARWPEIPGPIAARVTLATFLALSHRRPSHPETPLWSERLEDLCLEAPDPNIRVSFGSHLVMRHVWLGDYPRAERLREALTPSSADVRSVCAPTRMLLLTLEAICAFVQGNLDECVRAVDRGIEVSRTTDVQAFCASLLSQGVHACFAAGDLQRGQGYLRSMALALSARQLFDVSQYESLFAWLCSLKGDLRGAVNHAQAALDAARSIGTPFGEALISIALGQFLTEAGDLERAAELLARGGEIAQSMGSTILQFFCLVFRARLAFVTGRRPAGLAFLEEALPLGKRWAYTVVPIGQPKVLAALWAEALEAGIEVEYVQSLIRKNRLDPPPELQKVELWPWPVRVNTLGGFDVHLDGKPLPAPRKPQQRPLAMLKVLIALGPRGVSKEQLVDLLWPDALGDAGEHAFGMALHRLRRLLGREDAVELRDGRLSLDLRSCWVDAWAFERLFTQWEAGQGIEGNGKEAAIRTVSLAEKAVGLYQGPFLAGEGESWAIAPRERLRSRYLRLVEKTGLVLERLDDFSGAAEWYRKGLESEPLNEELCRRLMSCHERAGRRAEALAAYDRLKRLLAKALRIDPSPETEALARRILAGS